jgi:four helix bundle protein
MCQLKIMRDFKKIFVWERAQKFSVKIYEYTQSLPKEELYGITSQIPRAVISIPTNIAEGCGKNSEKDFCRFLSIALGSASEVQSLLLLIRDLNYKKEEEINSFENEIIEIKKMLYSLIEKINLKAES